MSHNPIMKPSINHYGSREDMNWNYICPSLFLSCLGQLPCRYKYHQKVPYHWQLIHHPSSPFAANLSVTYTTTIDIDDDQINKDIEKAYSNPDTTQTIVQSNERHLIIDFSTMTAKLSEPGIAHNQCQGSQIPNARLGSWFKTLTTHATAAPNNLITIKRLSTPSNIMLPKQPNTTEWMWYWQSDDDKAKWSQMTYDETTADDEISPFGTLERLYQQSILKPTLPIIKKFTLLGKTAVYRPYIFFNKLTMRLNGHDYSIRRRPGTFNTFVDWCYLDGSSKYNSRQLDLISRQMNHLSSPINGYQLEVQTGPCTIWSWVTFGDLSPEGDTRYLITAAELETRHISKSDVKFTHDSYTVDLYKKVMYPSVYEFEDDVLTHSVRIRRDSFNSNQLLSLKKYPSTWDPMPKSRIFVTITVPEFTSEFRKVGELFTASSHKLIRLRRIQNPASYNSFLQNKTLLENTFPNTPIKEETLFHGTRAFNIKLICELNFDPSLAGTVNGAVYGDGSYFAKNPVYSLGYCLRNDQNVVKLFVCRVLVGPTEQSGGGLSIPTDPLITLVDNKSSPNIFVNRLHHSFYPEYIAELEGMQHMRM